MGHTFSNINLHIIFSTQVRRNLLFPEMRPDLLAYMSGIARNEKVEVIASNPVDNHIHLLVVIKPTHTISDIVRVLKANSSRWIRETYPTLNDFKWQSGYAVFSVSESGVEKVKEYILNQEVHHHRVSFDEEFRLFLEKNKVTFDSEHYLD